MMQVAVVGAGAMGGLFGARLARAGAAVAMIDVAPATIAALRAHGLRLEDDDGDCRLEVEAGAAGAITGPRDLVLIFTKGPHTGAAAASVRHLVGAGTWVMTVQNGLGNDALISAALPGCRLAFGMTNWPADLVAPGHVRSHGAGEMRVWQRGSDGAAALAPIADLMNRAALGCILDPEVDVSIWEKVIFNAAMNSVAAVSGLTVGGMADAAEARALVDEITAEGIAVARACGIAVAAERVAAAIVHALAAHRGHKPSMLQDIEAGRATEVGSILDPIVSRGAQRGIACPVIATLARLVRLAETRAA